MAWFLALVTAVLLWLPPLARADETTVLLRQITPQGSGAGIGHVLLRDTTAGLRLITRLRSLPPGPHGLHVHEHPDCGPAQKQGIPVAGLAAGGHFDPAGTGVHAGPVGEGHLGDLPRIAVAADGRSEQTLLAPRLQLEAIHGRALIVHAGGDNYRDEPEPLGGGGARIACGLIP
jgi:Cu-Zn family superoxide dismutase